MIIQMHSSVPEIVLSCRLLFCPPTPFCLKFVIMLVCIHRFIFFGPALRLHLLGGFCMRHVWCLLQILRSIMKFIVCSVDLTCD